MHVVPVALPESRLIAVSLWAQNSLSTQNLEAVIIQVFCKTLRLYHACGTAYATLR
jgi:hypothetical protein